MTPRRRPATARAAALLLGAGLGAALSGCPETLDLKTGRFYACSRDGGPEPCSTGWRCGLEGYCHPATGGAWLCNDDGDCNGVWRCGANGVCVDPTADALVPRAWPNPPVDLVSPRFVPSKIDVAAVSSTTALIDRCDFEDPPYYYPYCGAVLDESVSFASSGKLVQAIRLQSTLDHFDPDGGTGAPFLLPDGGRPPRDALTWAPLPFTPTSIAVHRLQTFVLDPGGRLYLMDASLDGGQTTIRPAPFDAPAPFPPNGLKLERNNFDVDNAPILVAYERGGTRMAVYSLDDGGSSGALALPPGLTGGAILDLELWDVPASLILTTNAGLFLANRYDPQGFSYLDGGFSLLRPEFLPLPALARLPDGGVTTFQALGYKPVRVWVLERPANNVFNPRFQYMVVESVIGSGASAVHRVTASDYSYNASLPSGYELDPPFDAVECDPGDVVAAVEVHDGDLEDEVLVICRQPAGTRPDVLKRVRGVPGCRIGCQLTEVFPDAGVGTQLISSGYSRSGWFDVHGRIYFDEYGVGQNTLTMDRAPVTIAGGQGSLEAWTASSRLLTSLGTEHFVLGGPGLIQELGKDWFQPALVGAVRGQSSWRIRDANPAPVVTARSPQDGGQVVLFTLPPLSDLRQGPFQGVAGISPNGRPAMVVSAFDSLLTGEVGRDTQLQIRVVPNPRAAITSWDIAPAPPDAGAFLDGYAIAQARLFRVAAETPLRWIATEVEINIRGEPQAVWLDQGRGRVGFADGRVFALPSRVLVAPQLPEVPPQASGFAFACGHAFALGRRGLYRLDSSGGAVLGAWTAVDLDATVAGAAADPGWEGGVLHTVNEPSERSLYLVTAHGTVVRLAFDPASCPPPGP
ncbi:MAG TPA: hypothetical protein VFB81_06880 [Myxococcales bacterium]|nr:hypothetical protein [Myxococcales bacterium]